MGLEILRLVTLLGPPHLPVTTLCPSSAYSDHPTRFRARTWEGGANTLSMFETYENSITHKLHE